MKLQAKYTTPPGKDRKVLDDLERRLVGGARPLDVLLDRLTNVKKNGKGYLAPCPAHEDTDPSLSITEAEDGKVLVRCFAGCTVEDITAAVGLEVRDLFPGSVSPDYARKKRAEERERVLGHERLVVQIAEADQAAGKVLSDEDAERLDQAQQTIQDVDTEISLDRLAAMPPIEYERVRKDEAKRLGVRAEALDREVYQRRQQTEQQQDTPLVEEVEAWPAPVNGGELAEEIGATIARFMVLPDGAEIALSLWTLGSYCFDAFRIWPKLILTSPEKRCGKSTLLTGILAPLVHRGLVTSNISPAAIYRVIEAWTPTLLIDEADTFLHGNDELRGVINSGHTKSGAFVVRTVGDDHEPKKFSTWAPMAIAMIKTPPGTILDRSVVIRLRRRMPGERVDKLPLTFEDSCLALRRRCKRWAEDHEDALRQAAPVLPVSANDRALDNWTPLLAIAEAIGGHWPAAAVAAFHHLTAIEDEDDAIGPMILEDIRRVFEERNRERMHSTDLVSALIDLEERPWPEWRHGKPLTTTSLARLLKPYRLKSKQLRIGTTNRHGYELADFGDAFDRYLSPPPSNPPFQNATTLQPSNGAGSSQIQNATPGDDVAFQNPRQPSNDAACSVVAFQNEGMTGEGETDVEVFDL